ncbi:MAG TPA: efflux transporter periplasmic adaptor subunit, partial [Acinetobacter sp.]|nr:efflux transporter periplasmic adaptor subunit [Acinetobacter sp.]
MNIKHKPHSQWLWIFLIVVITMLLAAGLLWNNKTAGHSEHAEQEHTHQESEKEVHAGNEEEHGTKESLSLSTEQMQQHGVKLEQVAFGGVNQLQT